MAERERELQEPDDDGEIVDQEHLDAAAGPAEDGVAGALAREGSGEGGNPPGALGGPVAAGEAISREGATPAGPTSPTTGTGGRASSDESDPGDPSST